MNKIRYLLLFPYLLILVVPTAEATDVLARSTSLADVQTALTAAAAGDTVRIPAGTSTWNGTATITKSVMVIGAGAQSGGTRIQNAAGSSTAHPPAFVIDLSKDGPARISGIYFYDATAAGMINNGVKTFSSTHIQQTQVRIDHCTFDRCYWALALYCTFGVADHNTFKNVNKCARIEGGLSIGGRIGSYAAYYPIPFNSLNYMFFEDNTGTWDNWPYHYNYFSCEAGGSYVVRKNVFTMNGSITSAQMDPIDVHGNYVNYCGPNGQTYSDTSLSVQCYDNTFTYLPANSNIIKLADIRGGQAMIYNNTINGRNAHVQLREEDADPTLNTAGCAVKQALQNVWIWGNKEQGGAPIGLNSTAANGDGSAFYQVTSSSTSTPLGSEGQHHDYHLYAPGTLLAPPYPHPLITDTIAPPSNLTVVP